MNDKSYRKRRLTWQELAQLQGWPQGLIDSHLARGDESMLLPALGNGMSFNVMEAVWNQLLPLLLEDDDE